MLEVAFKFMLSALSDDFDRHGGGFTAPDAQGRYAPLEPPATKCAQQRADDACAAGSDGVTERTRAAVHVDAVASNAEFRHGSHRDHGESLVDFEQIDIWRRPANLAIQRVNRTHRRDRKSTRLNSSH